MSRVAPTPTPPDVAGRRALIVVLAGTAACWLALALAERLAPPDFYKFHDVARELYRGNWRTGIIPPLFPLLLQPLAVALRLIFPAATAGIVAGKLLTLIAGLGTVACTWRLLRRTAPAAALTGVVLLLVSPWFLKLLAFPTTDLPYLCLFGAAACAMAAPAAPRRSWLVIIAALLTRFEGVLLASTAILARLRRRPRPLVVAAVSLPAAAAVLFYILATPRFLAHLRQNIVAAESYLHLFRHPLEVGRLFSRSLLFFVPAAAPAWLHLLLGAALLTAAGTGVWVLWRAERRLAVLFTLYSVLFLVAKGYIRWSNTEREFRRVLTPLWCVFILCILGVHAGLRRLFPTPRSGRRLRLLAPLLALPLLVLARPAVMEYVGGHANKAAPLAAAWLNRGVPPSGAVILLYTDIPSTRYFLRPDTGKRYRLRFADLQPGGRRKPGEGAAFVARLRQALAQERVDYIVCDYWLVDEAEFAAVNEIKLTFYQELASATLLRLSRHLVHAGRSVGYIAKPIHVAENP